MIKQAVMLARGYTAENPLPGLAQSAQAATDQTNASIRKVMERERILDTLRESNWVIGGAAGAAARLGLNRTTLHTRMYKLGITRPGSDDP